MPVYGYMRVSTDEQVGGTSLPDQRRTIIGLAMQHAIDPADITWLSEEGASGAVAVFLRPQGATLAKAGAGDVVIVAKLDRFTRDTLDALTVIRGWETAGVRLIIGGFGDVIGPKSNGSAGRLLLEIMAVFAGYERTVIKERQRAGQLAKRRQGGYLGGKPPVGFQVVGRARASTLVEDANGQAAVRLIRARRAGGLSLRKIRDEVEATHGLRLSPTTIAAVAQRAMEEEPASC